MCLTVQYLLWPPPLHNLLLPNFPTHCPDPFPCQAPCFIFIYIVCKSEGCRQPLIKRTNRRTRVDEWRNFPHVLFVPPTGTFGVILSLFPSHSHAASSFLTEFWSMFSRVWLEGNAPGRCKSGEGCWHRGKQERMSKEKPVSISKWGNGS